MSKISYKLAKELKDAGFPQVFPQNDEMEIHDAVAISRIREKYDKGVYFPVLSELIEACGDELGGIKRKRGGGWEAIPNDWTGGIRLQTGSTPEEAVARLYIALNKK